MRLPAARWIPFVLTIVIVTRANAQASGTGLSLPDVMTLLSSGVSATRVAQNAKDACIAFPMDSVAEAELARAKAPRELVASLRTSCFTGAILEVITDPPGVDIAVDQRRVGASPYRTRLSATPAVRVQVRRGDQVQNFEVEVPRSTQVRVSFEMLEDTLALAPERTARQIADELGVMRQWVPPIARPAAPVAPVQQGSGMRSLLIGAISGAAGFAAAGLSPTPCHDKQVAAQDSYVGDKLYRAGTQVDLGVKPGCAAGLGAGVGIVSTLIARQWLDSRSRGQVRQYETAKNSYPNDVARWEAATERERTAWLAANTQVNAALATQANERSRIQASNDAVKRRNAGRRLPTVVNTPITATTPLRR
jgi:hypothetical protein